MAHRFLQANINHAARAQDLFLQSMVEWQIEMAVVAEPYFVPPRDNWVGDVDGLVVIVSSGVTGIPPPVVVARGRGYVAVEWRETILIGVYFSPNRSLVEFETFLDGVGALIGQTLPRPALLVGDLNAKSLAWGSPATDARGEFLEEWVTMTGLSVLNRGSVNTCVRWNGGSIVDVSFAAPSVARRVQNWRVVDDVETLSDHRYVRFDVSTSADTPVDHRPVRDTPQSPRWVLKSMDREVLVEASIVQAWLSPQEGPVGVDEEAEWFRHAMSQVCDAAMPRAKLRPPKRQVYWWSSEISDLRSICVQARRQYTRQRRRRHRDEQAEGQLYDAYRGRIKLLQLSIANAKTQARAELLDTLSHDPWGRPYKMVRGKLRPWAPPLTETLQPRLLEEVVSALFPNGPAHRPPAMGPERAERFAELEAEIPLVSQGELGAAVLRLKAKNKAPGPDGIPGRAWVLALAELGDRFRRLCDACLESGRFPSLWKTGRLVLLRKDGRSADSPSAYRPIVMLDEADKLFERVIAGRITRHLGEVGPNLSDQQFGFRVGRSTIDAVRRIQAYSAETVAQGGVLLAVSLDIANAFNTMPWPCVMEALKYHDVPSYLGRIVGAYLSERYVSYPGLGGRLLRREMSCGVPQGSVLGPLLWNIGYDWVLRCDLPPGANVTCYADDTLVTVRGGTFQEAACLTTEVVATVVGRIEMLGLRVAVGKSEALCFHGPRRAPPRGSHILIGETRVEVQPSIRYLGLFLDGRWNFREHFRRIAPRLMGAAAALKRLLPNLGGPRTGSRCLYLGVVRSMALYGAPIWVDALTEPNIALLRRSQRAMAVGVIRGYRTISFEAACLLAGSPPWDLEAEVHAAMYNWRLDLRLRGENLVPREEEVWKFHARRSLLEWWGERLAHPRAGIRTVEAIRPVLKDWVDRSHGTVTFRLVQVLSGHGCFGKYLCHVARREPTTECHHCGSDEDTAQHTLEVCVAWASQRSELVAIVGADLSLPSLIASMVGSEESWSASVAFCEDVMSRKEAAEREREITSQLAIRSRRAGRRRRLFHALQPP